MRVRVRDWRILRRQTVAEATVIIVIITFLSKVIGYIRDVLVANYFGASAQTDAFFVALLIPSMLLGIIAGGLHLVVIPMFTEKRKENPENAKIFVNQIFFITAIVLFGFSMIMLAFPTVFVKLVAYGFNGERLTLAVYFMRFLIIYGFFNVFTGFFTGIFQSDKQFLYPSITSFIANSLLTLSLFLFTPFIGINSWIVGEILFALFAFSVLFIALWWKKGFFRQFYLKNMDWSGIRHFGALLLPIIFTSGIAALNQIVDKTVASSLATGSIAALSFAQRIYLIPIGLLAIPLSISVYPSFSSFAVSKNQVGYAETFRKSVSFMMYLMIPISVIFIFFSHTIVRILFQHGAFDVNAANVTAFAVSMYSIGIFFLATNDLLRRSFFSFQDTKTPLYLSIIIIFLNIVFNLTLSRIWGIGGIALATTIAATIGFFLYIYVLRKKKYITKVRYRPLLKEAIKIISASVIIGVLALFFKNFITSVNKLVSLIGRFTLVVIILFAIYIFFSFIFKSEGFYMFIFYSKKYFSKIIGKV